MMSHTSLRFAFAALFLLFASPAALAGVPWDKITGSARFELTLNNQAVLDNETGLIWVRNAPRAGTHFDDAEEQCANLRIADRMGWRLPTVDELTSLVELGGGMIFIYSPAIPVAAQFQNISYQGYYWTSTPAAQDPDLLRYGVTFSRTTSTRVFPISRFGGLVVQGGVGVWCVRGDK